MSCYINLFILISFTIRALQLIIFVNENYIIDKILFCFVLAPLVPTGLIVTHLSLSPIRENVRFEPGTAA